MERWRVGWRSLHEGKSTSGLYLSLIQLKGHTFGLDKFNKSKLIFEVFFTQQHRFGLHWIQSNFYSHNHLNQRDPETQLSEFGATNSQKYSSVWYLQRIHYSYFLQSKSLEVIKHYNISVSDSLGFTCCYYSKWKWTKQSLPLRTDAIAYGKCSPRNHTLQINISGRLGSSTSGYTLCEQSMMAEIAIDIAMVNGCKITARSISDSLTRLFRRSRTCLLSDRYLHVKVVYKR